MCDDVNAGTTAFETVCSVPTTEVSATTKQPQVTIRSQAEFSSAQSISTPATQAKSAEGPTPPSSSHSTTPIATSQLVSAPVVSAPTVVVKQPQPTKTYTGQSSWKQYKEYFTRLALCNGWTTNVEKAQNLLVALEGAAAETVRGLTAEKDADYDAIWENLSRQFGHIDEPEHEKRKFDSKRQLESETIAVFEQALRSIFREAWPTADIKAKEFDSMLQRHFDPVLQHFLWLHASNEDFETTVGKARIYPVVKAMGN